MSNADSQKALKKKIEDFQSLSPEAFFEEHTNESPSFLLALPKQKAIKRVMQDVMKRLDGKILIKRANKRAGSSYAMDVETGVVFGVTELKPGGLVNAFGMKASEDAELGTSFVNKEIDEAPAPVIGIVGQDTLLGMRAERPAVMGNVTKMMQLNTSHSGLYLGAQDRQHLEALGQTEMTIAVTDRYEPILRNYLEDKKKHSKSPETFVMPELVACDGGTEDYMNRYDGIDVICDIVDSGTSVLEAGVEHIQLLSRSKAMVVRHESLQHFPESEKAAKHTLKLFQNAATAHFRATHDHKDKDLPKPDEILTIDEFFEVMDLHKEEATEKLRKGDNKPFYGVSEIATLEAA